MGVTDMHIGLRLIPSSQLNILMCAGVQYGLSLRAGNLPTICCGKLQSPKLCFKIPIFFQMMNPIDIRPSPCPAQSDRDVHAKFRRHTLRCFGVSGYLNSTVLLLNIDLQDLF